MKEGEEGKYQSQDRKVCFYSSSNPCGDNGKISDCINPIKPIIKIG